MRLARLTVAAGMTAAALAFGGCGAAEAKDDGPACQAHASYSVGDFSVRLIEVRTDQKEAALDALSSFGLKTIARYYDYPKETIPCKTLLKDETDQILAHGFGILTIFQHNNDDPKTFLDARGAADAKRALELAAANGQPFGSAIYFGVDGVDQVLNDVVYESSPRLSGGYPMTLARKAALLKEDNAKEIQHYEDFLQYREGKFHKPVKLITASDILPFVETYFDDVARTFRAAAEMQGGTYKIGAYGSGLVCRDLLGKGKVDFCWLAQSQGWPGYGEFKAGGQWVLLQQAKTVCHRWTYPRDPKPVEFDFDRLNPATRDFGQWSTRRASTAISRPTTCQ